MVCRVTPKKAARGSSSKAWRILHSAARHWKRALSTALDLTSPRFTNATWKKCSKSPQHGKPNMDWNRAPRSGRPKYSGLKFAKLKHGLIGHATIGFSSFGCGSYVSPNAVAFERISQPSSLEEHRWGGLGGGSPDGGRGWG